MRIKPKRASRRPSVRDQCGQALVLYVIAIVALLGLAGFAVDIGHAFYVKRSLQASADAAATAGAMELPNPDAAVQTARDYSGTRGAKNERGNLPDVTTSVTPKCLSIAPCHPVNAVVVDQTTEVRTFFARVLGIDSFTISARATACSPCGAKPLDVVLVLDRTLSMCEDHFGNPDPGCTDLGNAQEGMRTFLRFMNPQLDSVGLAVFPPAPSGGSACNEPDTSNYDSSSAPYVVVPLSNDYLVDGQLNESSALVSAINCQRGGGRTSYATAIERAQQELSARGRPDARDVIVFLSDGGANYGPSYYGNSSSYRRQPCRQGISSAAAVKAGDTAIYTIGYDLNAVRASVCRAYTFSPERPRIIAQEALSQIASRPENFYNQPSAGELNTIYTRIAVELTGTRLIPDDTA